MDDLTCLSFAEFPTSIVEEYAKEMIKFIENYQKSEDETRIKEHQEYMGRARFFGLIKAYKVSYEEAKKDLDEARRHNFCLGLHYPCFTYGHQLERCKKILRLCNKKVEIIHLTADDARTIGLTYGY